ncbi:MAG TPA: hypothetical protein PKW66_19890 [Polyangiaceae bacterium]|nr:hypothetical protein [Polyangiaceae bacterium]
MKAKLSFQTAAGKSNVEVDLENGPADPYVYSTDADSLGLTDAAPFGIRLTTEGGDHTNYILETGGKDSATYRQLSGGSTTLKVRK